MRQELIDMLSKIQDKRLIQNMLYNMTGRDITYLVSMLEFTDEDTMDRWMGVYSETMQLS